MPYHSTVELGLLDTVKSTREKCIIKEILKDAWYIKNEEVADRDTVSCD